MRVGSEIKQIVNQSLDACLAQFGGRREDCRYLVVGTTGLDSDQDGEYLRNLYGQIPGLNCPQCIMNDAELGSLYGNGRKRCAW